MHEYSKVIDKVMQIGLERINNNPQMDIKKLFRIAANGEERTVKIVVYRDADNGAESKDQFENSSQILWTQGLAHKNGKIVRINQPPYTVTYKITVSAWFRLIAQQNTFRDLYWSDKFSAEGEWMFRDLVVWDKFWNMYKDVVKLNSLEKLFLKDKKEMS